jgi:hypothetical protein
VLSASANYDGHVPDFSDGLPARTAALIFAFRLPRAL